MKGRRSTRVLRGFVALWSCAGAAVLAAEAIVIGQTLPLGPADDGNSRRIVEGTRAAVEATNALGGVNGRMLKLVTLDDGNDPARVAANVRKLVQQERAVAIVACIGDTGCIAAAQALVDGSVPLVGPMAPAAELARTVGRKVFRIRPTFEREAASLARQLLSLGVRELVLLSDQGTSAAVPRALVVAFDAVGLRPTVVHVQPGSDPSLQEALRKMSQTPRQAAVLDLSPRTIDRLLTLGLDRHESWPLLLGATSSVPLNAVMGAFKTRMLGVTTLVPDPEDRTLPLVREFQRDVDRHAEGAAATHAGFEAYIATRVCIEGLRRAAGVPDRLVQSLDAMNEFDLGGLALSLRAGRPSAIDKVEISIRARNGALVR